MESYSRKREKEPFPAVHSSALQKGKERLASPIRQAGWRTKESANDNDDEKWEATLKKLGLATDEEGISSYKVSPFNRGGYRLNIWLAEKIPGIRNPIIKAELINLGPGKTLIIRTPAREKIILSSYDIKRIEKTKGKPSYLDKVRSRKVRDAHQKAERNAVRRRKNPTPREQIVDSIKDAGKKAWEWVADNDNDRADAA